MQCVDLGGRRIIKKIGKVNRYKELRNPLLGTKNPFLPISNSFQSFSRIVIRYLDLPHKPILLDCIMPNEGTNYNPREHVM